MARKGQRKGFRSLPFQDSLTLGALAASDVVSEAFAQTVTEDTWLISADVSWSINGHTATQGPIDVGLAHSDYTAAEIEECLEIASSWDVGDKIAQEKRRRKVRFVGTFNGDQEHESLNDGVPIKTKLGFKLAEGDTLSLWAYNRDGAALTTGTVVVVNGRINARSQ